MVVLTNFCRGRDHGPWGEHSTREETMVLPGGRGLGVGWGAALWPQAPPRCLGSWRKGSLKALLPRSRISLCCPGCSDVITTAPLGAARPAPPPRSPNSPVRQVPLTDEEAEALRGELTCSGSQSVAELGLSWPPWGWGPGLWGLPVNLRKAPPKGQPRCRPR